MSTERRWPCDGVSLNLGRPATPIGGDAIRPYVWTPHWFAVILEDALKAAGISYRVEERVSFRVDVEDPDHARDRIILLDDISATVADRVTAIIERERKKVFEELDDEDD